jgi:hypothetical protein
METIYTKIFDNVKTAVKKASDEQLESDLYREELESEYTITPPHLEKDFLAVEIKSKTLTDNNAPEGFDYQKGDVVNFALYSIPIKGDVNLLQHKIEALLKASNKFSIVNNFLFVEEYYFEKIEDNDVAIEAVKEAMLKDVAFIEQYVTEVNKEIEDFKIILQTEINTEIAIELENRRITKETLDKLNPFN